MDKLSVRRVSAQAYALLASNKIDAHLELRSFIHKEAPGGAVIQAFCCGESINGNEFLRIAKLAQETHAANLRYMAGAEELLVARTEVDPSIRVIQNCYLLANCGAAASVDELRQAVECIAILADNLTGFSSAPTVYPRH